MEGGSFNRRPPNEQASLSAASNRRSVAPMLSSRSAAIRSSARTPSPARSRPRLRVLREHREDQLIEDRRNARLMSRGFGRLLMMCFDIISMTPSASKGRLPQKSLECDHADE